MGTDQINLHHFMTYPLTPVPYSIGTADGFLAKTNKAKGFHWLTSNVQSTNHPMEHNNTLVIEDGNALFYYLSEIPETFGQIAEQVFTMLSGHQSVIFSTDMYAPNSVKSMERLRRGTSQKLLIGGPKTKKPKDWKLFLKNDENKKQFIQLLKDVWSSDKFAEKLKDKQLVFVCDGKAALLTAQNSQTVVAPIPEIHSNQEETDSRIILYCHYAKNKGYKNVIIRSPDSDVFFILLAFIHALAGITVLFETGKKNKKRLLNITELGSHYSEEYCKALLGLHAFTGCDSTSAFKGKGKVRPIKLMLKHKRFITSFSTLGDCWSVSNELISSLEKFTCALYGMSRISSVNECRYSKLTAKCCTDNLNIVKPSKSFDTAFIPPAFISFIEHVRRVNYQVGIWKRGHINFPIIPNPVENVGWKTSCEGILEPKWFEGDMLPEKIIDELPTHDPNNEDDEIHEDEIDDSNERDIDYSSFVNELFNESEDEEEFKGFDDDEL